MELKEYPINTHDQVGPGGVYISYHPYENRSALSNCAQVVRVGYKTDPNAPWYCYGNKTFAGLRKDSIPKAKEWALERYGIRNWKRNGMGDLINADKNYLPLKCEIEKKGKRNGK